MSRNRRNLRRAQSWRWEPTSVAATVAAERADHRRAEARAKAIAWAVEVANDPRVVYLDTESTGFGTRAEIVDIAVISAAGQVLLDSLVRPTRRIPADATAIHGIADADVAEAPTWCELYDELTQVLHGCRIVVYNVAFDRQMVTQACTRYDLAAPAADWDCAMRHYARFHGSWDSKNRWYRFQKLERAVLAFGAEPGGHRAAADAFACRTVVLGMAATSLPASESDSSKTAHVRDGPWRAPAAATASVGSSPQNRDESDPFARWVRAAGEFRSLVEMIPAELRERPGACGDWSVRQVVAHAAGWEWEAARRLRLIAADPTLPDAGYNVEGFNAASVAVRADQDWSRSVAELAKASNTLAAAASALPHDRRTREWLLGRAIDFEAHSHGLRAWLSETEADAVPEHARLDRLRKSWP